MKAKDTPLLNNTITQNNNLERRDWFWHVASHLFMHINKLHIFLNTGMSRYSRVIYRHRITCIWNFVEIHKWLGQCFLMTEFTLWLNSRLRPITVLTILVHVS